MAQDYASRGFVTMTAGLDFQEKGADFTAEGQTGYIANHLTAATLITGTLPATAATGDLIVFIGKGNTGKFKVGQEAGVQVQGVLGATTLGVGGSITADATYQSLTLRCASSVDKLWVVEAATGTWTVA